MHECLLSNDNVSSFSFQQMNLIVIKCFSTLTSFSCSNETEIRKIRRHGHSVLNEKISTWKYPNVVWPDINWIKSPFANSLSNSLFVDLCFPLCDLYMVAILFSTSRHKNQVIRTSSLCKTSNFDAYIITKIARFNHFVLFVFSCN